MPTSAQTEMFSRRSCGTGHVVAELVRKPHAAGNPVRPVFRDLDPWRSIPVDLVSSFNMVDAVTEGSRGTGPHRLHDFVQSSTARGNEWLLPSVKYRRQPVGAESGVRADAAIIEYFDLPAFISVAPVRDSVRICLSGKVRRGVAAIAERLIMRLPTTAQSHLLLKGKLLAQPVGEVLHLRDTVGSIQLDPYL